VDMYRCRNRTERGGARDLSSTAARGASLSRSALVPAEADR